MLFFFPETAKTSRNLFRLDKNGVTVNISVSMPRVQTQLRTPLKSSPRQFFLLQILLCKVNVALIACILLNGAIFFSFLFFFLVSLIIMFVLPRTHSAEDSSCVRRTAFYVAILFSVLPTIFSLFIKFDRFLKRIKNCTK